MANELVTKPYQHDVSVGTPMVPSSTNPNLGVVPVGNADGTPLTGGTGGGGAVTVADGADVTQGAVADAANTTGTTGTISGKLRGIVQLLAGTLSVNLATAISNLIDSITAYHATDALMNGTTALTPKFAVITASASGVTTLVAAVTNKKIRVISIVLVANAAVNVKFQSHVTPTDITGLLYLGANGGFAPGYNPLGHFQTISGEALDINLSSAVAVGGWLTYVEV
jgi:hypothetical protein